MANYTKTTVGNKARVELHDALSLTGAEVSINRLQAGSGVPVVHSHRKNEEIYGVLAGSGMAVIDNEPVALTAGDWLRIAPAAKRQFFASSESDIVTNVFTPKLSGQFGKRKVMVVGCALMFVGQLMLGVANTNLALVIIGQVLIGAGAGPISAGIFARTSDVVDYGEWKYGVRSDGLISSCASFGMKAGAGFGVALGTRILSAGGYDGLAAVQTASAKMSIRISFGYLGAILSVVCLILLLAMDLDKDLPKIQADLEKR